LKEKVFFIKQTDNEDDQSVCEKLEKAVIENDLFSFIKAKDMVAVKTHFGEEKTTGYVRPLYFKMMGDRVKEKKGLPFLTETQTLYRGRRTNAVEHIALAYEHGFTLEKTGMPIIMADGLMGDEEIEVEIPGKLYQKVGIASLIVKAQSLIMVTHFTGHMLSGFGGALKNMGMGCSSRKGKLAQHSTAQPAIKTQKCTACGECIKWCPVEAIAMENEKAVIDQSVCIGCGQCLAVCRFDAVLYNWGETYGNIQEKILEHAMGVAQTKKGKAIYINFLNRISKDCDCMGPTKKIMPDIGIVLSHDPVAADAASLDLVEKYAGKQLTQMSYNIPYKVQLEHARKVGFGSPDYELVELG
jgi:uncharacterized Fe-S center protein